MSAELHTRLKTAMGYREHQLCENCAYFTGPDYSGNAVSRHNLCTLNPAVELPVSEKGYCKHFTPKKKP